MQCVITHECEIAATQIVPTGSSSVPPDGPAIPDVATAKSELITLITPRAISTTVCSLTTPIINNVSGDTPNSCTFISSV